MQYDYVEMLADSQYKLMNKMFEIYKFTSAVIHFLILQRYSSLRSPSRRRRQIWKAEYLALLQDRVLLSIYQWSYLHECWFLTYISCDQMGISGTPAVTWRGPGWKDMEERNEMLCTQRRPSLEIAFLIAHGCFQARHPFPKELKWQPWSTPSVRFGLSQVPFWWGPTQKFCPWSTLGLPPRCGHLDEPCQCRQRPLSG